MNQGQRKPDLNLTGLFILEGFFLFAWGFGGGSFVLGGGGGPFFKFFFPVCCLCCLQKAIPLFLYYLYSPFGLFLKAHPPLLSNEEQVWSKRAPTEVLFLREISLRMALNKFRLQLQQPVGVCEWLILYSRHTGSYKCQPPELPCTEQALAPS